jgi:hypothetical protein
MEEIILDSTQTFSEIWRKKIANTFHEPVLLPIKPRKSHYKRKNIKAIALTNIE